MGVRALSILGNKGRSEVTKRFRNLTMKTTLSSPLASPVRSLSTGKLQQFCTGKKLLSIACCMLGLLSLTPAYSQSLARTRMKASLPFEFQIGNQLLPAGDYTVSIDNGARVVTLSNATQFASVALGAPMAYRNENDATTGRLAFFDYGSTHVLKNVWANGQAKGYVIPESRVERELARSASQKPSLSEIATR